MNNKLPYVSVDLGVSYCAAHGWTDTITELEYEVRSILNRVWRQRSCHLRVHSRLDSEKANRRGSGIVGSASCGIYD